MNFVSKLFFPAMLCMAAGSVYGQGQVASATATSGATVIAPIEIAKNTDLNFGNIAVGTTNGTVEYQTSGTRVPQGGITLPATSGSPTLATFTVTGQGNYTFAITLPSTAHTIQSPANNTMTVTAFTSDPPTVGTLVSGTKVVTVGATLNATANQPVGIYTSVNPFEVKVEYN